MQIFRFDEEVSIPISNFGSLFRLAPLTDQATRVRVQVLYLPSGGRVGRHLAGERQLFAVVSGRGWVTGAEDTRRDLKSGYAAVWEAGEEHEVGTTHGLCALSVEGEFEMWATQVTQEIVVRDYDAAWLAWFAELSAHIWPAVEDVALRIDHVGSTAVPNLAAKPVIDMDIVVASAEQIRPVIERLSRLGYRWRGDLGVAGREAFTCIRPDDLPPHHLYLVVEDNKAHLDHWLLRDVLRADAEARERYGALKRANVELAAGDMDVYVAHKATFVAELLSRAREERGLPAEAYWDPLGNQGDSE